MATMCTFLVEGEAERYCKDTLSPVRKEAIANHLVTCNTCRGYVEDTGDILAARAALGDSGKRLSLEEVQAELGL